MTVESEVEMEEGEIVLLAAVSSGSKEVALPTIISSAGERASRRFLEFFTVTIRNIHTRRAYARAAMSFLSWCELRGVRDMKSIEPMMVAAYIEERGKEKEAQTVKQELAGLRMLFDWLVTGQVIPHNPAHSVRGPRYSYKKGKTPVLSREEAKKLLNSIDVSHVVGLRDRALIALMIYSFARVGATVGMNVGDYYLNGKRWWIRLHEKGGKLHEVPVHHTAEEYLDAYLDAAGIRDQMKTPLFRTTRGRSRKLTENRMQENDALTMVKRRAKTQAFMRRWRRPSATTR